MLVKYSVNRKAKNKGEIVLYGTIGNYYWDDGVSAKQFKTDLDALGNVDEIDLRLNSDGGVISDAQAMYSLLMQHKADVTVYVDGIAASAASFLAMAGREIIMAEGSFFMIHNARGMVAGEAKDFENAAEVLHNMTAMIRKKYSDRTGQSVERIGKWMDAETWFEAADAVKHGFATRVVGNVQAVALNNSRLLSEYIGTPMAFRPNRNKALALRRRIDAAGKNTRMAA